MPPMNVLCRERERKGNAAFASVIMLSVTVLLLV